MLGWWPNLAMVEFVAHVHQPVLLVCSIEYAIEKSWFFFSLIILIYHPQKENFWTHVLVDNMHMLMQFQ